MEAEFFHFELNFEFDPLPLRGVNYYSFRRSAILVGHSNHSSTLVNSSSGLLLAVTVGVVIGITFGFAFLLLVCFCKKRWLKARGCSRNEKYSQAHLSLPLCDSGPPVTISSGQASYNESSVYRPFQLLPTSPRYADSNHLPTSPRANHIPTSPRYSKSIPYSGGLVEPYSTSVNASRLRPISSRFKSLPRPSPMVPETNTKVRFYSPTARIGDQASTYRSNPSHFNTIPWRSSGKLRDLDSSGLSAIDASRDHELPSPCGKNLTSRGDDDDDEDDDDVGERDAMMEAERRKGRQNVDTIIRDTWHPAQRCMCSPTLVAQAADLNLMHSLGRIHPIQKEEALGEQLQQQRKQQQQLVPDKSPEQQRKLEQRLQKQHGHQHQSFVQQQKVQHETFAQMMQHQAQQPSPGRQRQQKQQQGKDQQQGKTAQRLQNHVQQQALGHLNQQPRHDSLEQRKQHQLHRNQQQQQQQQSIQNLPQLENFEDPKSEVSDLNEEHQLDQLKGLLSNLQSHIEV